MEYFSTRDSNRTPAAFTDILLSGLAPDGGLYVPAHYPKVTAAQLTEWRSLIDGNNYAALAAEILSLFIDDIPRKDLDAMTARAYRTPVFAEEAIVSASSLEDGLWIGHISGGPTAAFKDMAMQLLGELFEYELGRRGAEMNILGATSGDTGSSAEYAMRGRDNIRVFMLTPAGRMTPFQQAQMFSLEDPNIFNIALDGVFDDCQDVVKATFADAAFTKKYSIGAVNSINVARVLAQVVYYFALYFQATTDNGQKLSFSVPTGNFGNIYAAHVARQMGLPIDKLIVANNENNNLDRFFTTGDYTRRGDGSTLRTSSPSMDISRPSNFERFVYDLLGSDASRIQQLFGHDVPNGGFNLSGDEAFSEANLDFGFLSGTSTHVDRIAEIQRAYDRDGVLIDPHTADGVHVARKFVDVLDSDIVVVETALPVKFAETITEAIGTFPAIPERFEGIEDGPRAVTELPNDVEVVKQFIAESIANTDV